MDFPCTSCGLCCGKIREIQDNIDNYKDLPVMYEAIEAFPYGTDTNGACVKLQNGLCSVYEDRPLLCNIKKLGEESRYDLDAWFRLNAISCNTLILDSDLDESYLVKI